MALAIEKLLSYLCAFSVSALMKALQSDAIPLTLAVFASVLTQGGVASTAPDAI